MYLIVINYKYISIIGKDNDCLILVFYQQWILQQKDVIIHKVVFNGIFQNKATTFLLKSWH